MWAAGTRRPGLVLAALAALGLALEVLAARRRRPVREVLFFPSRPSCTEALLAEAASPEGTRGPCPCPLPHGDCALSRLLRHLLSARRSLELCLFAFSSPQLGRAVRLLHRRGVRVRVVTDAQYMALKGSQIGLLRHAGIQVRHDQETGFMHHKFAIVDRKMLITGSLNWTTEAIQNNRENILIMEDAEYVQPFLEEFERIWEIYDPLKYTFFSKENK
ncbi:mitochondrial cardiolipin hydrolase [Oxyura jamaicensis]|uniref:mitochondrial cardiolipin hydrolase n=1 Tax=Oxyura jamaicensis TaxID=8884 RepID=UPI0015A6776B|nr:mitochondrial cardiolipin hydrolase [Oxyura jamaicensis]